VPVLAALCNGARQNDDRRVKHVAHAAQNLTKRAARALLCSLRDLLASKSSAVNLSAIKSRTVFKRVGAAEADILANNARTCRNRLKVRSSTTGAINTCSCWSCNVTNVTSLVVSTQHQDAVVHKGATNARANSYGQDAIFAVTGTVTSFTQSVSMNVIKDAARKAKLTGNCRAKSGSAPAGHKLICVGDVARTRVNNTSRRNTHARDG